MTETYCALLMLVLFVSTVSGQGMLLNFSILLVRLWPVKKLTNLCFLLVHWNPHTSGDLYIRGNLRLVNSTTHRFAESGGRLEFFDRSSLNWVPICITGFGQEEALLACKQLGYRTVEHYGTVGQLG